MKDFDDVIKNVNGVLDSAIESAKNGNFDDVLNKTKDYAEKATKKSAQRLEISKKKIELLDTKTKLSKAYEKYGKLVYLKKQGGNVSDSEIESAEAAVELQKMRADMLDDEIGDLRDVFQNEEPHSADSDNTVEDAEIEVTVVEPDEDE